MDIRLVSLSPVRVAYLRRIGPYGPGVTRFWQQEFMPWLRAHGLEKSPCYGIGQDDPDITPPAKCRYDACVAVPQDFMARSPAGIARLPGGRYAVADCRANIALIGAAWTTLLREWLPSSGMQPDARTFFEHYPVDTFHDPQTGVLACQICLPVRPL